LDADVVDCGRLLFWMLMW